MHTRTGSQIGVGVRADARAEVLPRDEVGRQVPLQQETNASQCLQSEVPRTGKPVHAILVDVVLGLAVSRKGELSEVTQAPPSMGTARPGVRAILGFTPASRAQDMRRLDHRRATNDLMRHVH
eukprot:6180917-Lingulodinium_polyedra.AAC.1